MSFKNFCDESIPELLKENYNELIAAARNQSTWIMTKIRNHIERFCLNQNEEYILNKIMSDYDYALFFIKPIIKQGYHEKCQLQYLEKFYPDIVKLANTIYFDNGQINNKKSLNSTKSIDFCSEKSKIWFTAKHTETDGGSQNNQFKDLQITIHLYSKIPNPEYKLCVIISGSYYTTHRIEALQKTICEFNKTIFILNLNDDNIDIPENKTMSDKKQLGQFYTTKSDELMQNLVLPPGPTVVEPFVGNGDLIPYCRTISPTIEIYDIQPQIEALKKLSFDDSAIITQDTLLNPPDYKGKYCITNPPYLARNQSTDKKIFDLYNENDLYKCFIRTLITGDVEGGCLIIPLNFWNGMRLADVALRDAFLSRYQILYLNIFENAVFEDTSYSVCSFSFKKCEQITQTIEVKYYPSKKCHQIVLKRSEKWCIGYEVLNTRQDQRIKLVRITDKSNETGLLRSNLLLHGLDSVGPNSPGYEAGRICLKLVDDDKIYVGKVSSRTAASIAWNVSLDKAAQQKIVNSFNRFLNINRAKYNSMFLSNYRENQRKRISFELAFRLINTAIVMYCRNNKIDPFV